MAVVENVYKDKESCWISEDAIEASYYVICSRKCMAHYAFKQCILSSSDGGMIHLALVLFLINI